MSISFPWVTVIVSLYVSGTQMMRTVPLIMWSIRVAHKHAQTAALIDLLGYFCFQSRSCDLTPGCRPSPEDSLQTIPLNMTRQYLWWLDYKTREMWHTNSQFQMLFIHCGKENTVCIGTLQRGSLPHGL